MLQGRSASIATTTAAVAGLQNGCSGKGCRQACSSGNAVERHSGGNSWKAKHAIIGGNVSVLKRGTVSWASQRWDEQEWCHCVQQSSNGMAQRAASPQQARQLADWAAAAAALTWLLQDACARPWGRGWGRQLELRWRGRRRWPLRRLQRAPQEYPPALAGGPRSRCPPPPPTRSAASATVRQPKHVSATSGAGSRKLAGQAGLCARKLACCANTPAAAMDSTQAFLRLQGRSRVAAACVECCMQRHVDKAAAMPPACRLTCPT